MQKGKFIVILVLVALVVGYSFQQKTFDLRVEFFDIGQGDSSMIHLPNNQQILIDGGPNEGVLDHLDKSMPFFDKKIEIVILTHGDADHLAGLVEVIQDYRVERVYMPNWEHTSGLFKTWKKLLKENEVEVTYIEQGLVLNIGDASMEFLHPSELTSEGRSINDESVVCKFIYHELDILFTGDISIPVEERLVFSYGEQLEAEILKVPHHGSKSSSSDIFIDTVQPGIAVIQAGKENKFNHPHERVLYRYDKSGVNIFRTDILGTIEYGYAGDGVYHNKGMESFISWLFGENWERVYTFHS